MANTIDARGLSCPQPVMLVTNKIRQIDKGEIVVLVDTDTAKENVSRCAILKGWQVEGVQPEDGGYRIAIRRDG